MTASTSDQKMCQVYEESARYDVRHDALGRASSENYSSDNKEASATFQMLAKLRNVGIGNVRKHVPLLKSVNFEIFDRLAMGSLLNESEKTVDIDLHDFNPFDVNFDENNEFYAEALKGTTMFRTCLGSSPALTAGLGVQSEIIGSLLEYIFAPTPLDYAVAGMHDRENRNDTSDGIVMTTEYIDPELDLVYDMDGTAWEFDGELHCVKSQYNHLREIRDLMMSRNGRVNKTHLLMFAAMRLACVLDAIQPLSVKDTEDHRFNIRGYLMAIINGAVPLIRMFYVLCSIIPPDGPNVSFNQVPSSDENSDMTIWVENRKYKDKITVVTDGDNFKRLIIKAIIEGSSKIDTSREPRDEFGRGFLDYGNNRILLNVFLSSIGKPDMIMTMKTDREIRKMKTFIALSLNSKHGTVRDSLVTRNNGLKQGIDLFLEEESMDKISQMVAVTRGLEEGECNKDVQRIVNMDEFGVSDDHEVEHLGDSALDVLGGDLYELRYPTTTSVTLRRRKKVVGRLLVVDGKFSFKKGGVGRLGLLTIFEPLKGVQVLGSGVTVDFNSKHRDATAIANACLCNVFGIKAALFVLEHILLGNIPILRDTAPRFLQQAKLSDDGLRITSFLHPSITEKLAFYKSKEDDSLYFDSKTLLGKQKLDVSKQVVYFGEVDEDETEYEERAVSIGKKYLG